MRRSEEQVRRELVDQWLRKANEDIRAAAALLAAEPPFLFPSCFHSQQAAEKYLKALLTWRQVEFPKTHALGELLDLLPEGDAALAKALAGATALNPYGVEVRYPSDQPEPTLDETAVALRLATQAREAVLRAIPSA